MSPKVTPNAFEKLRGVRLYSKLQLLASRKSLSRKSLKMFKTEIDLAVGGNPAFLDQRRNPAY